MAATSIRASVVRNRARGQTEGAPSRPFWRRWRHPARLGARPPRGPPASRACSVRSAMPRRQNALCWQKCRRRIRRSRWHDCFTIWRQKQRCQPRRALPLSRCIARGPLLCLLLLFNSFLFMFSLSPRLHAHCHVLRLFPVFFFFLSPSFSCVPLLVPIRNVSQANQRARERGRAARGSAVRAGRKGLSLG